MNIRILIYIYMAICISMILFNFLFVFLEKIQNKMLMNRSTLFKRQASDQIRKINHGNEIETRHFKYLNRKLKNVYQLMAFDDMIEGYFKINADEIERYLNKIRPVFLNLTFVYSKKEITKKAYFAYLMSKYHVSRGYQIDSLTEILVTYLKENSIHCQDNVMAALYSYGNVQSVLDAILIINTDNHFLHKKRLTEGLLTFSGNHEELTELLWKNFDKFNLPIQIAVLNYIRYKSSHYKDQSYSLLINPEVNSEIHYACIRYFGKYKFELAKPLLLDLTAIDDPEGWEYSAISAASLSNYPGDDTVNVLKQALHSANWYVRTNAAKSLNALNIDHSQLTDVLTGNDPYAREIMEYQLQNRVVNI